MVSMFHRQGGVLLGVERQATMRQMTASSMAV